MDGGNLLIMDPYIVLSWVNMKLRDECSTLDILCAKYDVDRDALVSKLNAIGYEYDLQSNQFKAV